MVSMSHAEDMNHLHTLLNCTLSYAEEKRVL